MDKTKREVEELKRRVAEINDEILLLENKIKNKNVYTINLNESEAQALLTILRNIWGHRSGFRGYTQTVYCSLIEAGVKCNHEMENACSGSITFSDI